MARPKKVFHVEQSQPETKIETQAERPNFNDEVWAELGSYRSKLVKHKLDGHDLKKLIALLLIEWAQGRVKL